MISSLIRDTKKASMGRNEKSLIMIKSISRDEAKSAIYLDFEGNKDKPPSFAGTVIDGEYQGTFLEEEFKSAARHRKMFLQDLPGFTAKLLRKAETEGRIIIAWSTNELRILSKSHPNIEEYYLDANKLVKKFFKDNRKKTIKKIKAKIDGEKSFKKKPGLKDYLQLDYVDYNYPKAFNGFSPSKEITEVRKQLTNKSGLYKNLSRGRKLALGKMIKYNEHDCMGMKHLIEYVFSRKPTEDVISY